MKMLRVVVSLIIVAMVSLVTPAQTQPPNIVLIISDDHGWQDYGFMGHPHIRTPHLDKLAAESRVFPRGYVPTSLCSPSLATLITGRYPHEHLITGNDPPAPPGTRQGNWRNHPQYIAQWNEMRSFIARHPLLPKLLQQKGYLSFQAGKWWMGNYQHGGFTEGMTHGDKDKGGRHGDIGLEIGRNSMQPISDFMSQAQAQKKPFLIWYAPMLPHDPHNAPDRLLAKYKDKAPNLETAKYWANVEWFDESCGQLLNHLDQSGLRDNTIVIYVTDNGWVQGPDRDSHSVRSKRTPYDAGIRTPIMLRWPGKVKPGKSQQLASSLDIMPTLLQAAGIQKPAELPGLNLLDNKALSARKSLFGALFTHDAIDIRNPSANLLSRWIIDGEWKLLVPVSHPPEDRSTPEQPRKIELYRITTDPEERKDLSATESQRIAAMMRKLDAWWKPASK